MKKIYLLFLSFVFVVLLASCHGKKSLKPFELPESFDTTKHYEITFWSKNDSNKYQQQIYNDAISEFESYYPNITVKNVVYYNYNEIYNDVVKNISTYTTPNVCISYPDNVATYISGGNNVVVKLDELIDNSEYGLGGSKVKFQSPSRSQLIEKFVNEGLIGDSLYTLPFIRSSEACYINKTYLNSLGFDVPDILTWDFVWEVSKKALELKEENKVLIPMIYKSVDNMLITMLKQKNIAYTTDNAEVLLFNEETKALLEELRDYGDNKKYFSTFDIVSYPGNFFNRGECIFAIDSTAGATWMGSTAPLIDIGIEAVDFETVVRPIPQYDVNDVSMISQGPSICVFNKADNNEVLASWLFAQYLLTKNTQIKYAETEGYIPVTYEALNSEEYHTYLTMGDPNSKEYYDVKIAASQLVIDNIDKTFVTPVFNGSIKVRNAAKQLVNGVFKQRYRGDDGITKLFTDTKALYKIDEIAVIDPASSQSTGKKTELGKLPAESITLIVALSIVWLGLVGYALSFFIMKKKIARK